MCSMTRGVAFFDFDGTLVKGDSLIPYLGYVAGWPKMIAAFAKSVASPEKGHPDTRTGIKSALLKRTLAGVPYEEARAAASKLAPLKIWKPLTHKALLKHKADGFTIVVATGALELYIHQLLEELPVDLVIATEMEVKDGILTGAIQGGNCVRQEKARRVEAYLKTHGPFDVTYGYGNAPHDLPMLALLDHKTVI